MGLAASQARYLALTARKSDLEYQSQTINTRRIQLAYRTAEIAQAYSEGMNNKQLALSHQNNQGDTIWEQATFQNMLDAGFVVIPTPGSTWNDVHGLNDGQANPYLGTSERKEVISGYDLTGSTDKEYTKAEAQALFRTTPSDAILANYFDTVTAADGTVTYKWTAALSEDAYNKGWNAGEGKTNLFKDGTASPYTAVKSQQYSLSVNQNYKDGKYNWELQALCESGRVQIITRAFYDYLKANGYDPDTQYAPSPTLFAKLQQDWTNNKDNKNIGKQASIVDWRADETQKFSQRNYTEDDAQVLARYERETAEVQAQDKILEVQEKNIETQHKAIETELESIQKVIQQNIEKTFKIFS